MTNSAWIVVILLIIIVGGANLLMIGMARGSKNVKFDGLKHMRDSADPWKKEDQGFEELNKKVKDLKNQK